MPDLIGFRIRDFAPVKDLAWLLAGDRGRLEAMRAAAGFALRAMTLQLTAGVSKTGAPLRPIAGRTAQSRAANVSPYTGLPPYSPMGRANPMFAPLTATGPRSRTITLLRCQVDGGTLFVHWDYDPHTGLNWGEILARHAKGFSVKFVDGWVHVPPRDVIGMAPQYLGLFTREFERWWAVHRKRLARPGLQRIKDAEGLALKAPVTPRALPAVVASPATLRATRPTGPRVVRREQALGTVIEGISGGSPFGRPLRAREKVVIRRGRP